MGLYNCVKAIVESCKFNGLQYVVISPGSRNAPLIKAFTDDAFFSCISVVDERSAGFVALGIAQAIGKPTILTCTSGSALLNYYPAIAEAFYAQVPLLILSADRPKQLIDQWDGQCIRQENVYGNHVLASATTPEIFGHSQPFFDLTHALIQTCKGSQKGPVHLNIPMEEPLYDFDLTQFELKFPYEQIESTLEVVLPSELKQVLTSKEKILWFNGASNEKLQISSFGNIVFLNDIIGNGFAGNVHYWEKILSAHPEIWESLQPEVLITTGKYTVSKILKQFLRKYQPKTHWHISECAFVGDPFGTQPKLVQMCPKELMETIAALQVRGNGDYLDRWRDLDRPALSSNVYSELEVCRLITETASSGTVFHWGNSMPVRYASELGRVNKKVHFSNRGTSGIDGCLSTAVGHALVDPREQILIIGDLSFFYDANALWNELRPANLKIVILNNFGGKIFEKIHGPANMGDSLKFQTTPHQRNAKSLAGEHGITYLQVTSLEELNSKLDEFLTMNAIGILEVAFRD
jgi:2-succinyl-5-enolpyruvyl-6-hydroxy-3-cyclohexene-1-carboxylate synthase